MCLTVAARLFTQAYHLVVVTNCRSIDELVRVNELCRSNGVHFIASGCHGLLGYSFTDLGDEFVVVDKDGEKVKDGAIVSITEEGVVESEEHGLADGDTVTFVHVEGIAALNDGVVRRRLARARARSSARSCPLQPKPQLHAPLSIMLAACNRNGPRRASACRAF